MGTTSYSEVSSYLLCRRKHFYGYGMSLERNESSESLAIGKALHKALEVYYGFFVGQEFSAPLHLQAKAASLGAWETERPEVADPKRQDLTETLNLYFNDEPFVSKGYKVLAVEREFVLEYDDEEGRYPFVIDLVLEDPWGEMAVVDHKTGYEFLSDGAAEHLQPQIPLYIGALRALRYPAVYGIYNQFRTRKIKAPTVEQLLRVTPMRPTDTRIKRTFSEQVGLAQEVSDRKAMPVDVQDATAYRTANKMVCQTCAFAELCIADLQGSDRDLVIATQFHPRTRRSFAAVSEEMTA